MATATASGASGTLGKGALSMFHMPTANRPDFTTRATNCALLTISVICVCVLVVCGVMIVREYALAKGYHASTCQVKEVVYAKNEISCMFCGPGPKSASKEKGSGACKKSRFPCVQIKVTFSIDGHERVGLLHPDSLQAASPYSQCSYTKCLKLPEENKRVIEKYAQSWRDRGSETFDCFVDAEKKEDVIVSKMHTMEDVLHSMLWPSLIIVVCGCIFLKLEMKRRNIVACPCLSRSTTDPSAESGDGTNSVVLKCQPGLVAGEPCKVECKLLKCTNDETPIFKSRHNSLTALDRLMTNKDCRKASDGLVIDLHNGKIGTSLSAEGLLPHDGTHHQLRPGLQPLDIRDSPVSGGSPSGSKVKGLETPV